MEDSQKGKSPFDNGIDTTKSHKTAGLMTKRRKKKPGTDSTYNAT